MSIERAIMAFAGTMILVSVLLTLLVSPYFIWFTAFIGANLLQSTVTGFCPVARMFRTLGLKSGSVF